MTYDITSPATSPLQTALHGADAVVSMVGLLAAPAERMIAVQQEGAGRVLDMAVKEGVKRKVLISAIGSDINGETP